MKQVLISLLLVAQGCATYYTKPGVKEATFQADKVRCKLSLKAEGERMILPSQIDACLVDKGWVKYEKS